MDGKLVCLGVIWISAEVGNTSRVMSANLSVHILTKVRVVEGTVMQQIADGGVSGGCQQLVMA